MQDWRRRSKPEVKIGMARGSSVLEMAVIEDFIYLTSSSSPSTLQVNSGLPSVNPSFWIERMLLVVNRVLAGSDMAQRTAEEGGKVISGQQDCQPPHSQRHRSVRH